MFNSHQREAIHRASLTLPRNQRTAVLKALGRQLVEATRELWRLYRVSLLALKQEDYTVTLEGGADMHSSPTEADLLPNTQESQEDPFEADYNLFLTTQLGKRQRRDPSGTSAWLTLPAKSSDGYLTEQALPAVRNHSNSVIGLQYSLLDNSTPPMLTDPMTFIPNEELSSSPGSSDSGWTGDYG